MQKKENELKMTILSYKEEVERKEEEIKNLQEQLGRVRNNSVYGGAYRSPQQLGEIDTHNT